MKPTSDNIQRTYLLLVLLNTLAASFIWGINTIFLLDAGLSNLEAFAANAFFTVGQVLFEVPTGIVADTWGRRVSYLLGTVTLAISTVLYLWAWQVHAPFVYWAITSVLLGLGFTFFSGATEAWLVDALHVTGFKGTLDSVFAKGQIVGGIAMLVGSVGGGVIAQMSNLGVPYILRSVILLLNFVAAFFLMKDLGFAPKKSVHPIKDIQTLFKTSVNLGFSNPSIRWVMVAAPFTAGVGLYAFYAMQPYLLRLYGDEKAYGIAGFAAAIVASAQIVGGLLVPYLRKIFQKRTTIMLTGIALSSLLLALLGITSNFWIAIGLLVLWALVFAAVTPVRQSYLNGLIPSDKRATVLSFDSLMGSSGGVVIQPILGRAADVWSYAGSYLIGAMFSLIAFPFVYLARRGKPASDTIQ